MDISERMKFDISEKIRTIPSGDKYEVDMPQAQKASVGNNMLQQGYVSFSERDDENDVNQRRDIIDDTPPKETWRKFY